ncbi:MAG: viroporin-like protein [Pastinaca cytorhabdovirus 1]|uniref:Viroporin-like protein n=1 Tax=Pastinaca cytorhabdovirus 1 TaxID=2950847 RepID=A0AAE9MP70_9RHAB|nr:MAG: viroporin-like protein [Pastinaca cytorhabdovirus 1]
MEPWKILNRIMEGDISADSDTTIDVPGSDHSLTLIYALIMIKLALIVFVVICCKRQNGRPTRLIMKWA